MHTCLYFFRSLLNKVVYKTCVNSSHLICYIFICTIKLAARHKTRQTFNDYRCLGTLPTPVLLLGDFNLYETFVTIQSRYLIFNIPSTYLRTSASWHNCKAQSLSSICTSTSPSAALKRSPLNSETFYNRRYPKLNNAYLLLSKSF